MLSLGIDSSAVTASCALVRDGAVLACSSVTNKMTHSETLMPMISSLFDIVGLTVDELDFISVSAGPGSFTGLRIGISTVKGLAFKNDIPCVGVSTLEALAYNLVDCEGAIICPCMDARRGEFYNALFESVDGRLVRLCDDRAVTGKALTEELRDKKVLVNGDGAVKFAESFLPTAKLASPTSRLQNAASVALLGEEYYKAGRSVSSELLMPGYLRASGAERKITE